MKREFEILNNFFDKIIIITLPRAGERQANIEKELAGLNYEFFFGEDKKQHTLEEVKRENIYNEKASMRLARSGNKMTLGHICCSWSHRKVYEEIIKNNWQKILIFEDDVVLIKENADQIEAILSQIPSTWELLYLGWMENEKVNLATKLKQTIYHIKHSLGLLKWNHTQIGNLYPRKFTKNLMHAGFHNCTHAFALTLSGAKKLIQLQTPIVFNADALLAHAITTQSVEAFISLPKIFTQASIEIPAAAHSFVNE